MPVLTRSADRFQRALEGEHPVDPKVAPLVETGRHLLSVGAAAPGPDAAFVAALRERLMVEAQSLPAPSPAAARAASARRAATRSTPVVVVVGHGLPRALAGAAASALLVGGIVGVVSRSSVPGESLYPVKSWLDGVAVRLATSDYERGTTYLGQAQEHISDSRDLAARSEPSAHDIDVALGAAAESVQGGQLALDRDYARTGNPQALIAERDFTARALPQVEALRSEVPAASLPAVRHLESLLRDAQVTTARRIAACGPQCGEGLTTGLGPSSLPSVSSSGITSTTAPGKGPATSPSAPASAGGGITVPDAPVTGGAGGVGAGGVGGAPPMTAGTGGATIGGGGAGATLSTGGATVRLPAITATVPVPSGTVSVPLPSATVGTGGVTASVPGPTVGPVTVPGVTVTLP